MENAWRMVLIMVGCWSVNGWLLVFLEFRTCESCEYLDGVGPRVEHGPQVDQPLKLLISVAQRGSA